jgi:stage V sporulation protein SpoVS
MHAGVCMFVLVRGRKGRLNRVNAELHALLTGLKIEKAEGKNDGSRRVAGEVRALAVAERTLGATGIRTTCVPTPPALLLNVQYC